MKMVKIMNQRVTDLETGITGAGVGLIVVVGLMTGAEAVREVGVDLVIEEGMGVEVVEADSGIEVVVGVMETGEVVVALGIEEVGDSIGEVVGEIAVVEGEIAVVEGVIEEVGETAILGVEIEEGLIKEVSMTGKVSMAAITTPRIRK